MRFASASAKLGRLRLDQAHRRAKRKANSEAARASLGVYLRSRRLQFDPAAEADGGDMSAMGTAISSLTHLAQREPIEGPPT
jgi:hypothetical protein